MRLQPSSTELSNMRQSFGGLAPEASGEQPIVPLFSSNQLSFEIPPSPDDPNSATMARPLFFGVSDFRAAWIESGRPSDELPGLELTDLRKLTHDMEHDMSKDWRSVVLMAPAAGMTFAAKQGRG